MHFLLILAIKKYGGSASTLAPVGTQQKRLRFPDVKNTLRNGH